MVLINDMNRWAMIQHLLCITFIIIANLLFRVRGSGFGVRPRGVLPFDYVRKRFSGFYRFKRFKGVGAAHKNREAPQNLGKQVL